MKRKGQRSSTDDTPRSQRRGLSVRKTLGRQIHMRGPETPRSAVTEAFGMVRIGLDPATRPFAHDEWTQRGYQRVLQRLVERRRGEGLRVWVPSCGAGQEAYALGITLLEALDDDESAEPSLQIFGTDLDPLALQVARAGRYPLQALAPLSPEQRARFFIMEDKGARPAFPLRRAILFALQDFRQDPPFHKLDLVACSNALLQCPDALHPLLMVRFHFSLRAGGVLHVGAKHLDSVPTELFHLLDRDSGTFLARHDVQPRSRVFGPDVAARPPSPAELTALAQELRGLSEQRLAELETLDRARADLHNFVESTDVLALICDRELRVVHASSAIGARFSVVPTRGTLLRDLARRLPGGRDLVAFSHDVQATGEIKEWTERLAEPSGCSYLIRLRAYRTPRGEPDGVVAVFTDVSALERARDLAAKRERQQKTVADLGLFALGTTGGRLSDTSGLEALYTKTLKALADVFGLSHQVLFECTHDARSLVPVAARGISAGPSRDRVLRPQAGGQLELGLSGPGLIEVGDPCDDEDLRPWFADSGVNHGVVCPLRVDDSLYGVLVAYAREATELEPEDLSCVQSIANLVSGALTRQRARRRLALEHAVGLVVAKANELSTVVQGVEVALVAAVGATAVEVWRTTEQRLGSPLEQLWPATSDPPQAPKPLLNDAITELRAIATTEARATTEDDPEPGMVTELAFPLVYAGVAHGVVGCRCSKVIALDEDLLRALATIGRTVSEFLQWKRLDDALRKSEQRFRAQSAELEAIYATLPVGLSIYDKNLSPIRINRRLVELRDPLEGPSTPEQEVLRHVLETGKSVRDVELAIESQRGRQDWLCSFVAVKDSRGEVASVSSVVQDITEQKRVEQALRDADRQKDEFLAMLGHELRNPLAAIRNATELLGLHVAKEPHAIQVHGVLDRQTRHMSKLIDGLLDVSRIVRGKLVLERENLDLRALLQDVVHDRSSQFEQRKIALELDAPENELFVNGDRVRLAQIFDNILSNAAKFSITGGRVRVTARSRADRIIVDVDDDGVGIEPQLLPHVFEPFRQAQQSVDRSTGGLGLGLALVRGLVELHGGSVRAESAGAGQGTRISVEFGRVAKVAQASSIPPPNVQALRVLVIEDNFDMGETLAELLRLSGHQVVDVCTTGLEGVEAAQRHRPDVVLCDFGLPGELDGLAVAPRIRAELERSVQLIAITGYGDTDTRRRAREAGFDAFLVKPVTFELLQKQSNRAARKMMTRSQDSSNSTASG